MMGGIIEGMSGKEVLCISNVSRRDVLGRLSVIGREGFYTLRDTFIAVIDSTPCIWNYAGGF